jgi:hypothetical protein
VAHVKKLALKSKKIRDILMGFLVAYLYPL